jgi:hypothetical protein
MHFLSQIALGTLLLFAKDQTALLRGTPFGQETKREQRRQWAQYAAAAGMMRSTDWDAVVSLFDVGGIGAAPSSEEGEWRDGGGRITRVHW